ncbi:unnamed protein product [Cercopithifilaria johnstoni]|uniref:Uncharacterized protein n=1 Tax=Cercopithifilaria johnstoni TaxID=2874296 RepID=A0A8J2MG04_9BILA|nr:unnamed protein product [Cercopithifilaria johnstoni]
MIITTPNSAQIHSDNSCLLFTIWKRKASEFCEQQPLLLRRFVASGINQTDKVNKDVNELDDVHHVHVSSPLDQQFPFPQLIQFPHDCIFAMVNDEIEILDAIFKKHWMEEHEHLYLRIDAFKWKEHQ